MYIESYKQLKVWQRSIELVKEIYQITKQFPKSELYGLYIQMRRSAISIPSNIAEGYRRRGVKEYIRFLSIANASAAELETQIIISKFQYSKIAFRKAESLLEEVQKMLIVMIKKMVEKLSNKQSSRT
jgi:four helix bundle protein